MGARRRRREPGVGPRVGDIVGPREGNTLGPHDGDTLGPREGDHRHGMERAAAVTGATLTHTKRGLEDRWRTMCR